MGVSETRCFLRLVSWEWEVERYMLRVKAVANPAITARGKVINLETLTKLINIQISESKFNLGGAPIFPTHITAQNRVKRGRNVSEFFIINKLRDPAAR